MKKKSAIYLLLFLSNFILSQNDYYNNCPVVFEDINIEASKSLTCSYNSQDYTNYFGRYDFYKDFYNEKNIIWIPIDIHIWQKNDGTGNFIHSANNITDFQLAIQYMSQVYNSISPPSDPIPGVTNYTDAKIRFRFNNIYFNKSSIHWGLGSSYSYSDGVLLNSKANELHPEGKANFKIHLTGASASAGGYAVFPTIDSNTEHFIVTFNQSQSTNFSSPDALWAFAMHLAHEMGHNLDLYHTYQNNFNSCNQLDSDYLSDVFGIGSVPCPHQAGWGCDPLLSSNTCTNNIMGGTADAGYISPKQVERMHRALSLKSIKKYTASEDYQTNKSLVINQDYTWDFNIKLYEDLIIKSGSVLTVKCVVEFVPQAKVIIEPGAKLILDGGKLTNEKYYNTLWQGVEVWGTTNQHQSPASQPTFQGKLEIINGGTIENAINGVRNWKPGDYNKIGGVIVADNGVFLNNSHSVEFVIYENFLPTNPSVKLNNISKFTNTDFIINNNYLGNKSIFDSHATLWGVYGISFVNCHFSNDITLKSYTANKNRAIYSVDAGYTVSAGCGIIVPYPNPCPNANLLKSTFTGFNRAIEASGTATTKTMVIDQAVFTNNLFGVYINDFDNYTISRSSFNLGYAGYTNYFSACYGVYTQYSSGYKIEENEFSRLAAVTNSYGLRIIESGPENNRSYKNKFLGLTHGQYITGINRNSSDALKGYQFICNEFNGNSRGVHIGTATSTNGIRLYQGEYSPLKSAGNVFLNTPSGSYTIYNASTWPISYYHNNGNTIPTFNTSNVTLGYTSNSNTCLSTFGGIVGFSAKLTNLKSELSNLTQIKDDLEYNLMNLLDDGNTENFKEKINLQWNSDVWELRNKLIEKSPYITRESILEAIGQHILPNAMILEICLANPDATKGESFIDDLNSKNYIPLPEYMTNYIRNNWDEKTVRSILEAEIASLTASSDFIKDEILRLELSQEEIYYDSISLVISNLTGTKKELKLIELAIEKEDWSSALSILQFALDNENFRNEWDRFAQYEDYISFRSSLNDRKISQLHESEIDHLITISEGIGKVSEYAKNILCFFYDICIENIDLEEGKSIYVQQNDVDLALLNDIFYQIEIYPNPAENFTSLKWEITNKLSNCEFRLYDIEGNLVLNKPIEKNVGEMIIDTRTLINGVYLCTIENQGEIKSSKKLIIQKVN